MTSADTINTPLKFNLDDDLVPILFYVKGSRVLDAQTVVQQFLSGSSAQDAGGAYKPPLREHPRAQGRLAAADVVRRGPPGRRVDRRRRRH